MRRRRPAMLAVAVAMTVVTACGSDQVGPGASPVPSQSPTTTSTSAAGPSGRAVPTPEELASTLVLPGDLDGKWTSWEGPDPAPTGVPGVVPEDQRGNLPRLELCDKARPASLRAAEQLRWQAFRQLNLSTPDAARMHQVFVQEFLLADAPAEMAATFRKLRAGLRACVGTSRAYGEGMNGTSRRIAVPQLGDAAFGTRLIVDEPSPRGPATWDLRNVLVRDGAVLMNVQLGEVGFFDDVKPLLHRALVDDVLTSVAGKLP